MVDPAETASSVTEKHTLNRPSVLWLFCSGLLVNTAKTDITEAVKYYFTGCDMPTAPALLSIKSSCNAQCVHDAVDAWLTHVPDEYDALWMVRTLTVAVTNKLEHVFTLYRQPLEL